MRRSFLTVLVLVCTFGVLHAQDDWMKTSREEASGKIKKDASDTTNKVWKKGGMFNLNVNQGSLTNWAAGGDKFSFSVASSLSAFAFYKKGKHSWDNVLNLAYGYVNTTSLGGRKSDDLLSITSKYGYDIGKNFYLSGLVDLRSQFTDGYLYTDTSKTLSSRFFAPAYLVLSPGIDYKPTDQFSIFFSPVTGRYVFVMDDYLASQGSFGVDTGKHIKSEFGAYLTINTVQSLAKGIVYKGRLDLYSNYRNNPQNVDLYMTNSLNLAVNKHISAVISLDMIYDDDVKSFVNPKTGVLGPRLQVKEVIGVGFSAKF
ncbi:MULTISPECIES: DUF3078 domain-containing protein [unclassified Chitinophaga]|uniref:DUF3078 domain-containing protein n=1 Tax=unclassified Chitinophaga TaxID=2619133 RepID=UPI0009C7BFF6|nr:MULTISPECIES: DUF3078 domain-containing protein [unclassified Chitinophaga]OMP79493.1 hypothetical protein BW716_09020 [[Flexibacter] sp. ATCC 35208]WPV68353.1 DUF3078 domain-containing protein [Chitinophaga sp. LS1]